MGCTMQPDPKFDKAIIEAEEQRKADEAHAALLQAEAEAAASAPDLGAEAILAAPDRAQVRLVIPEWGGAVYIRQIGGWERDRFELSCQRPNGRENFRARFAALVLADKDGKPLFTPGQAVELGKKNAKALDRIFDEGARLNGLTGRDVEALEKN